MSTPESKSPLHSFCAFCSFILPGTGQLLQKRFGTAIGLFLMFLMTSLGLIVVFIHNIIQTSLPSVTDCFLSSLGMCIFFLPLILVMLFSFLDAAVWRKGTQTRIPKKLIALAIAYFFLVVPMILFVVGTQYGSRAIVRTFQCRNQQKDIVAAFHSYNDEHGHFPPAYSVDEQGKPLHSWRVLILPYISEEALYKEIRLNEPWDSAYNRQFHSRAPSLFRCPTYAFGSVPQGSFYSMVIETDSVPDNVLPNDLLPNDCNPKDIMLAERKIPVNWMNPTDAFTLGDFAKGINVDPMGISSNHKGGGVCCAMRDGRVITLFKKK